MKHTVLIVRAALAVAAISSLGSAVASEGISKYYSLQASAKSYSTSGSGTGGTVVLVRYKAVAAPVSGSSVKSSASSSSVVSYSYAANTNGGGSNKADTYESVGTTGLSSAAPLASASKTNSPTTSTPSTWGFTNSGNYSITTANGGVALNNVYVGGDLNITVNVTGGTWNTSCHGGTCGGAVSPC